MTPEHRYEALATADPDALEQLADRILVTGVEVAVTCGPESVSAPVRIPGPEAGSSVVIGHVALTRCRVTLEGTPGDGVRRGFDFPGAVAAAVCDAECERGGPLSGLVDQLCDTARSAVAERRRAQGGLVHSTRLANEQ